MGKIAKINQKELGDVCKADVLRSIINTFAINTANLTALYLTKTNLHDAIVLADTFHNDKFYCLLQVLRFLIAVNFGQLCSRKEHHLCQPFAFHGIFRHGF